MKSFFIIDIHSSISSNDFLLVTSKTKIIPSTFFIVFNATERNLSCPDVSHIINLISFFSLFKCRLFSNLSNPIVGKQSDSNSFRINDFIIEVLPTSESPNNPILILR